MAIPDTMRSANLKDSIKKFFVDNLYTALGIYVSFDRALEPPTVQGRRLNRWVAVLIGKGAPDSMATQMIEVFCCTRGDAEGFKLAQLFDTTMGLLIDLEPTDTFKRIPLYKSMPNPADWTQIGTMLVQKIVPSEEQSAPDDTKFRTLTVLLRYASGL